MSSGKMSSGVFGARAKFGAGIVEASRVAEGIGEKSSVPGGRAVGVTGSNSPEKVSGRI